MLAGVSLVLSILAILSLIGISVYFYMDTNKQKKGNNEEHSTIKKDVESEKVNRLSGLKFVVDQINTVNRDIKSTYDSANSNQDRLITNMDTKVKSIETGFGSLFGLKDGSKAISLSSLADVVSPNIELLKKVNVVSGMDIKNAGEVAFNICGDNTPGNCAAFNVMSGKKLQLDASEFRITGTGNVGTGLNVRGNSTFANDVSAGKFVSTTADIHTVNVMNSTGATASGFIKGSVQGGNAYIHVQGNATPIVIESTGGITLKGNVRVDGNMAVTGSLTTTSGTVTAISAPPPASGSGSGSGSSSATP